MLRSGPVSKDEKMRDAYELSMLSMLAHLKQI